MLLDKVTYSKLRYEYTTKQLIQFTTLMKINLEGCGLKKKRELANKIWDYCHNNPKATFGKKVIDNLTRKEGV